MQRHKVLLVTGGNRGIGKATALMAATKGYKVCLTYLSGERDATETCREITAADGTAVAFRADISREADLLSLFQTIDRQFGRLDVLVNNAGILDTQMRLEQMSAERLQQVFAVNAIGTALCSREAVKRMSLRHGGHGGAIVNVSSAASRLGSAGEYVDYAASKGAVDSLTIGLSREVAADGIRVNAVRPAFIHTDIHARGGEPGRIERLRDSIPMKRGGQPQEVADAILWLASDEASYVTGTFVDMAGGK